MDGSLGLDAARTALRPPQAPQPAWACVSKQLRTLADYGDMIYADTANETKHRHKAFLRKRRKTCSAASRSPEEAGDWLFTFARKPASQ